MSSVPRIGGIVLCGGRSTRMGRPKLALPFGAETMLERVVRIVEAAVSPVVVVAAVGQEVPALPSAVRVVRDEYDNLGPLAGVAAGLGAIRDLVDAAYITACDTPLLRPAFVAAIIARLGDADLAVVRDGEFLQPLAAVYRTELESKARAMIADGRLRPLDLIRESKAVEIGAEELRQIDPHLDSLRNANTPELYAAALRMAGVPSG
ncbi:MAG: molybdenum cofactor guanylyltransferase [Planctomycetaceae bacterium]|nr:molybdenum cofactor guanylyltransferase [Planctomycetaceae bacterium]